MSDPAKPHDHLEIHALVDGGYVIREGIFDSAMSDRAHDARWQWHQERAAFSKLEEALAWMATHMTKKSPIK